MLIPYLLASKFYSVAYYMSKFLVLVGRDYSLGKHVLRNVQLHSSGMDCSSPYFHQ